MSGLSFPDLSKAEAARYSKIQNIIRLLSGSEESDKTLSVLKEILPSSFEMGGRISVDGEMLRVGRRTYHVRQIGKVVINTEGSMAVYDACGKKICGALQLNAGTQNIQSFCIWVRKFHVPAEVASGKTERFLQYAILFLVVAVSIIWKILRRY